MMKQYSRGYCREAILFCSRPEKECVDRYESLIVARRLQAGFVMVSIFVSASENLPGGDKSALFVAIRCIGHCFLLEPILGPAMRAILKSHAPTPVPPNGEMWVIGVCHGIYP